MTVINLIQTEKASNLETEGFYSLATNDYKLNKIQITNLLKKVGLNPEGVQSTKSYHKTKRKGKGSNFGQQKRPKKFYVKLKTGEKIEEETIVKINQILQPIKTTN